MLCAAINAWAQSVPPAGTPDPKLVPRTRATREAQYTAHHRILLNVQVSDMSGQPVTGLDDKDFTLRINHEKVPIASFQAVRDGGATAHARAFFVIDMLNNSSRDLSDARKAIEKLAATGKELPLPTSLAVLTERGMEASNASRNAEVLAAEWERMTKSFHQSDCTEDWNNAALGTAVAVTSVDDINRVRSRHATADRIGNCLNEKYQLSYTALTAFAHRQQSVPGRAILIWIGPGWPILSGPEFAPLTPDERQTFFGNLVQASAELREGQVTLDAVSWPPSTPIARLNYSDLETLMRGIPTAAQASANSVAMPVLAHLSGGQVYVHKKSLTSELAACLADGISYYVLGFDSAPSAAPDEFRAIEVTIDKPDVTVRTIPEHYAQP